MAGVRSEVKFHGASRHSGGEAGRALGMADTPLAPDDCQTMPEVRAGIDALDADLVAMLASRFAYMRAAARIKPSRDAVRDEARKAEVIANAVARAGVEGAPADLIARLWDDLVEASIAYELSEWDRRRTG
jgi:isochorismate pyruvate lyase